MSFPRPASGSPQLLGGHVDFVLLEPPEAGELIRAGKLRALVQIADKRLPGYEDVPTLQEAGFKVPNVPQARGIVGPPGMPADAVAYYEDMLAEDDQVADLAEVPAEQPARRRLPECEGRRRRSSATTRASSATS